MIGGNTGSRGNNRGESETAAGLIAGDVGGRGSNHIGGETGSRKGRVQTFRGRKVWRTGLRCDGLEGEKIGDGAGGRRQFEVGSINHFLGEGDTASDLDGLRAVMSFAAASPAGSAGLSSA